MTPGGFAIGLHISYNGPSFLFQTFPQAWIDYYASNGLHLTDPNFPILRGSFLILFSTCYTLQA